MLLQQGGAATGTLKGVTGEIYDKGELSSRFSGDDGEADQSKQTFVLRGHVMVTSKVKPKGKREIPAEMKEMKLTAAVIRWDPLAKKFKATGSVMISGPSYEMGPYPEIWATPDLNKMGTPDRFSS